MSRLLQVQPFLNAFSPETLSAKPMDTTVFPFNAARFYSLGAAFLRPVNTVSAFTHDTIDTYQSQSAERNELLVVGRSNVGKSSLINALTAQDIATTSKTPGKTQQLIFHQVAYRDRIAFLVDAPGYGYASAPAEEMNKWAKLMQTYLKKSMGLKRILALVDAQAGVKKADETLFAYLCELRKPYIVVLTKADKLRAEQLRKVQKEVATLASVQWAASPLLFSTSAKAQYGLMELRAYLAYLLEEEHPKPTDTIKRIKSTVKRIGASLDQSDRQSRPVSRSSSQQREEDHGGTRVLEELRTALRTEREKTRSLQKDVEDKEQLLREFNEVDAEMKRDLEQLQEDFETQAQTLVEAQREAAALRKKLQAAEDALRTAEQRCKDFEELAAEYKQETHLLTGRRDLRQAKELEDLSRENEELRQEVKDINSTAELYQEQIAALRSDYQQLRQEYLASREQPAQASEEEVEEMRNRIQELELVVTAFQKPAELQYDSRSSSPSSLSYPPGSSTAQICESLVVMLKLNSYDSILGTVQKLSHHSRVVRKLGELIRSMSPPEDYTSAPTSNQVLKWVSRLAKDYLALQEGLKEAKDVLSKVKRAAGVAQAEEVVQRIQSLDKESQALAHLRDAVVSVLGLPTQSSIREIREALTALKTGVKKA